MFSTNIWRKTPDISKENTFLDSLTYVLLEDLRNLLLLNLQVVHSLSYLAALASGRLSSIEFVPESSLSQRASKCLRDHYILPLLLSRNHWHVDQKLSLWQALYAYISTGTDITKTILPFVTEQLHTFNKSKEWCFTFREKLTKRNIFFYQLDILDFKFRFFILVAFSSFLIKICYSEWNQKSCGSCTTLLST